MAKARELAERAFAADPSGAQIEDTLGWILLAQGEADKAMTYLSAANSAAAANPDIQYHLAVALQPIGRSADAQAMLENSWIRVSTSPNGLGRKGCCRT